MEVAVEISGKLI